MTDQTTVDYRTSPPSITPVATAWQAWWEGHDTWDGDMLYADLDTAKHHSAVAYVGEEYSWLPGDDPDDEAPETALTWELKYGRWRLLDDGQDTGVRLAETRTYAAPAVPAGQAPDTDQAAVLDRIRQVVRRLAAHAVGFQDVLDDTDRGPWGKTVAADIAELRRLAAAPAVVSAVPGQTGDETPGPWLVQKICCGHDDGEAEFATWEEADRFREIYVDSSRIAGHERSAIVRAVTAPAVEDEHTSAAEQPAAGAQQPKEA